MGSQALTQSSMTQALYCLSLKRYRVYRRPASNSVLIFYILFGDVKGNPEVCSLTVHLEGVTVFLERVLCRVPLVVLKRELREAIFSQAKGLYLLGGNYEVTVSGIGHVSDVEVYVSNHCISTRWGV